MKTNLNKEESGRSMVEMLGVLAVIGVLSITGISGYTTAMNKHKANEILDAASKRAVAVSTQLQRGNTSPTLAEFEDEAVQGVTYGEPVKFGEDQFSIPLTWDSSISSSQKAILCKELKAHLSEDGEDSMAQVDTNCTRIAYNNDLSVGATTSKNTNYDGSTTSGCASGHYGNDCEKSCSKAHQVVNSDNTGCVCANGYNDDDNAGECVENDCSEYNSGTCPTGDTCQTCQSGETSYYKITACSVTGKVPNADASECIEAPIPCDDNWGCSNPKHYCNSGYCDYCPTGTIWYSYDCMTPQQCLYETQSCLDCYGDANLEYVQVGGSSPTCKEKCGANQERINGECVAKCSATQERIDGECVAKCSATQERCGTTCVTACTDGYERSIYGDCTSSCVCNGYEYNGTCYKQLTEKCAAESNNTIDEGYCSCISNYIYPYFCKVNSTCVEFSAKECEMYDSETCTIYYHADCCTANPTACTNSSYVKKKVA